MSNETEAPSKKKVGVGKRGVGAKNFSGSETLSMASEQLQNSRDEGEFCSPLSINSLVPDPDNAREIITLITKKADSIRNIEYKGKTILEHIKEDGFDASELPYSPFINLEDVKKETGYDHDVVSQYWSELISLAESIYNNGLKQPISVRRDGELRNRYVITFGHRRYLASYLIFAKTVRSVIANTDGKKDKLSTSIDRALENLNQQSLNFWEQYLDYEKIIQGWNERYGKTPSNRELSRKLSHSRQTLDRISAIHKAKKSGYLTETFVYIIKNQLIHRANIPTLVKQAVDNSLLPEEFDETLRNHVDEQNSQWHLNIDQQGKGSEGESDPAKNLSLKKTRKPSAQIKIRDLDFGKRIVKALQVEFKELGDISVEKIDSIDDLRAILKRLL